MVKLSTPHSHARISSFKHWLRPDFSPGDESNSHFSPALLTESLSRVHMGKELILEYPSFRNDIESMDLSLQDLEHAPSWSIKGKTTHSAYTSDLP